ncbi:hypothetical protein GCK32_015700, partial [Trichostrongylus colubriformis]
ALKRWCPCSCSHKSCPNNAHKSHQSFVVLLSTRMRTGLLLLIFTSCAMALLMFRHAKVGDRVELYLGNQTKTWCRRQGTCYPFLNSSSTVHSNGSLIFESVQESDSGMYYSLEAQVGTRIIHACIDGLLS